MVPHLRTLCVLGAGVAVAGAWAAMNGAIPLGHTADLTVVQVYRQAEQSLLRSGMIYHATVRTETVEGPIRSGGVEELWVAPRRGLARDDVRYSYRFTDPRTHHAQTQRGQSTMITTRQGTFRRESPPVRIFAFEPQVCHGKGLLAADVVLGCPGPTTKSTTTVQSGQYAGRPAVVLVTSGTTSAETDSTTTTRLYLDPVTDLPIAGVTTGTMDTSPKTFPIHGTTRYSHVFVPAARVGGNFFNPASIGYVPPAIAVARRLGNLPANFTAY